MDFNPNFTPPAEAFGHMESMATHMFGSDSAQVQGLKDAFSGQRSFESLDALFGGPPQNFGPSPAWGDAPPPGMDFGGPAPWMLVPNGGDQGWSGMGPPPSVWGGEGQDSGPPAWMIPSFEGTSFGSFEGGDAPWMGDFSGSDSGEEETEGVEALEAIDASETSALKGEE